MWMDRCCLVEGGNLDLALILIPTCYFELSALPFFVVLAPNEGNLLNCLVTNSYIESKMFSRGAPAPSAPIFRCFGA